MKATKVSKAEQMNLCRSMSSENWQNLCRFIAFLDALDDNIELARCMAEDYALNGRTPDKYRKQEAETN